MFDWLIVGAGFAGSVLAERLANQLGESVLLIDRRCHVGGNAHDRFDETGRLVPVYGRHVLQTDDTGVLRYLSQFTRWRLGAFADGSREGQALVHELYESAATRSLHGIGTSEIDVLRMRPAVAVGIDTAYEATAPAFSAHPDDVDGLVGQALVPAEGYTRMFERMLSSHNVKIMLNTDFAEVRNIIPFRRLVYTGSIDEYFDYCYGKLPYQSITADERGYPLRGMGGDDLFRRYEELAAASTDVFFIGRLATYRYFAMAEVVAQALATFDRMDAFTNNPEWRAVSWNALRAPSTA